MPVGRPIPSLTLTSEEKQTLERWSSRHPSAQALALRYRLVLACAEGLSNTAVARRLPATLQTAGKWRSRFLAQRLNGLLDEPGSGAPRKISDTAVEHVLTLTLEHYHVRPPTGRHAPWPSAAG